LCGISDQMIFEHYGRWTPKRHGYGKAGWVSQSDQGSRNEQSRPPRRRSSRCGCVQVLPRSTCVCTRRRETGCAAILTLTAWRS